MMHNKNKSQTSEPLSYEDKVILTLYKEFFGEEYDGSEEAKTMAQNMCFLLSLKGFRIGGYHYTWN